MASQIMGEILPALGIEPNYSASELAGADAAVPYVVGKSAADAKAALKAAGSACTTVGSGDTVTDQTPPAAPSCPIMPPSCSIWAWRSRMPPAPSPTW
ncbi:MAG: PASTA domain-containing protein [Dysosmobacter sp.]